MQKTILYVDDEEENLTGFKAVFHKLYTIYTASTTEKAYEIIKNNEIHLIITDQKMPGENGLDFLKRISPEFPLIVCIILTAYSDMLNVLEAINQGGVFRYILKPWNKAEMQMAMDTALQTYFLKKENLLLVEELKRKNHELQKSEEQFRNIFNTSVDSIFITDLNGQFLDVNKIASEKTGISKEEFMALNINTLMDENGEGIFEKLIEMTDDQYIENSTSYINPLSGCRIYLETRSKKIEYSGIAAYLHITRDITDRHNMEKKLLTTIIETEEKERSRVARELHDGVSPVLAASRLYARLFTSGHDRNLEPVILEKLEETIDEAIQSVTEISNNLSPHILQNFGLSVAIENFLEKLKNTRDIKFSVLGSTSERLPENVETTLYRITVELINNTLKYANATEAYITFGKDTSISYTYSDNGCGFDWDATSKTNKGMGYYNIISRIKMLNGNVIVNTGEKPGMEVNITIPTS